MTVSEEPTLYDVLEVDPESSIDELRAAVERARETYGPESVAVYALVEEGQIEELRAKLDEAEEVLLDPVRRVAYDRSIGRLAPATLWAEDDDDEDGEPLPPVEPGPHARAADLDLEAADDDEEVEEEEDEPPRQQAFALDVGEAPGTFGRTADAGDPARTPARPEALLSGDWAAAVPSDARPPAALPPPLPVASPEPIAAPLAVEEERSALPPSLGLRVKPAAQAPELEEEELPAPPPSLPPAAPLAPAPVAAAPERPPELPSRPRGKLEIPSDAEFTGELLRRVRESYGLSLQQVAERTRITRIHLENVEADRYDHLPATVYLRGILVNLARELRLDPARVSKTYLLAAQRGHARAP
ncbi:MAG TPA: helix-turn-helix domain-containing protein [Myxococcaceae bacterium]|nr:helix-turn-helix domain-containing protein [Myxococcaceae bacterium]